MSLCYSLKSETRGPWLRHGKKGWHKMPRLNEALNLLLLSVKQEKLVLIPLQMSNLDNGLILILNQ